MAEAKDRFGVTLDEKQTEWVESLINDKIFSNRVHAVELCISLVQKITIEDALMISRGKKEVFILSENEIKVIEMISKKMSIDENKALNVLIYRGLEEISRNTQNTDRKDEIEKEKIYFK